MDVSLALFSGLGFFNTSVDAIAKEAGISRAALYQYFPGKDEIFLELMEECGGALVRVTRRLGPLAPTTTGFDNLNWWLGEWGWVFERYSTMFVQWANVAMAESVVQSGIGDFVARYRRLIAARLAEVDLGGLDPEWAAIVMTTIVLRVNLYLHTRRARGRSVETMVDSVSVFLQLLFFPDTPPTVFDSLSLRLDSTKVIAIPDPPATTGASIEERTRGLTKRATRTVGKLVEAGCMQFSTRGYYKSSVDDIVAHAGIARGTFYKYFNDKQDLLLTVCAEAAARNLSLAEQLRHISPPDSGNDQLRNWLASFAEFEAQFRGSIDIWSEGSAERTLIWSMGTYVEAMTDSAILDFLGDTDRSPYPFDPIGAMLIFRAILERLGPATQAMDIPLTSNQIADRMTLTIERGFFPRHTQTQPAMTDHID